MFITDEIPLSFSVAASSALRIGLASSPLSALPIGTRAYRTGSRSSPYTQYIDLSSSRSPNFSFSFLQVFRPAVSLSRKQPTWV